MSLANHFRAFLLSLVLILSVVKFRNEPEELNINLPLINKTTGSNVTNIVDFNVSYDSELNLKRKRYRHFIVNNDSRTTNDSTIYFLGLFELSTKFGIRNEGFTEVAAAQLAVKHVNERSILRGHSIQLLVNDTECDPGAGIDRYFHALYSKKTIMMLLGSGCSNVTESLANIVPYWNILQISFGSTSPSLSDRSKFPLFFRTVPPDSSHNSAKLSFIQHFKWNTIVAFGQRENTYLLPLNNLVIQLELANISSAATITFGLDNFKDQLKHLKELDIRIIVGSFSPSIAAEIFCEVYVLGMYGPDYVWILQNQHENWWVKPKNCHRGNIRKSLEGTVFLSHHNQIPHGYHSVSGLSNAQLDEELKDEVISKNARQTYDAIWAMCLVLQKVERSYGRNLSEFYYDNDWFLDHFVKEMQQLKFMGLSGPIKFQNADRIGNSAIQQIQGGALKDVAIYYSEIKLLDFKCKNCSKIYWQDNRVPIAKRTFKFKLITIPKSAFYAILTFAISGIVTCLCSFYFNFHFRHKKVVKLSSPQLNNIIVFGCILIYASVVLLGIDYNTIQSIRYFPQLCTMRVYLLSAGFSLAFGSMFAKTYRVHRIFTYTCTSLIKNKILQDKRLISLILLLLLIDAVIMVFWTGMDPMRRELHNLSIETSDEDRAVMYQPQVEICCSNNTTGWYIAIYGYKGFLLIMGVYMAWETRHIKVDALNDSQYIGICVYSAVFSFMIVLASSFLAQYTLLAYIARTTSILLSASLTLLLLFVPKLKSVFWKAEQDPIVESMGFKIECNTRRFLVEDPKEPTHRMEVLNKVYRCEIEALDRDIAHLEDLLYQNQNPSASRLLSVPSNLHKTPRASWPSVQVHNTQFGENVFLSETKLNVEHKSKNVFDRLRIFVGRIPSALSRFSSNTVEKQEENFDELFEKMLADRGASRNVQYPEQNGPFYISLEGDRCVKLQ